MINAVTTMSRLDWSGWWLGIMGALVSGGAGAISSGVGVTVVDGQDPDHFILKGGHMIEVMAICFLVSAIISLAKWLQLHPIPNEIQVALQVAQGESDKAVAQASKVADAVADAQAIASHGDR
jgi:hypothetical protein